MYWSLPDEDDRLREIARMALRCCPQRVTLESLGTVVVLGAAEYARLTGKESPLDVPPPEEVRAELQPSDPRAQEVSTAAHDHRDREWVWEWDEETQSYVLPWAKDADPGDHPGLELLNFMQNSPLAQAFRDGDFTPEEWDAACRIGR